jgi:hypothetical protein
LAQNARSALDGRAPMPAARGRGRRRRSTRLSDRQKMEIDPRDVIETAKSAAEIKEARTARLNAVVAITVALLATFMGICKVKDDNIVQAMQAAQADKLDHWAFYQARNVRQELAETTVVQLELARLGAPASAQPGYDAAIAKYKEEARYQAQAKQELKTQAEQDQRTYDALNYRDDQFDLSDALLAISIALLAVTALTQFWALYWMALVPTFFGVLMGVAGLTALPIHPETLVKLLS